MFNNADELVVANTGEVSVANVGTTLPVTPTAALAGGFFGLGYCTTDGVSMSVQPNIIDIEAWQSRQAIRRSLVAQELTLTFVLQQWNEETVKLAFGGGDLTEISSGIWKYSFPDPGAALDERSLTVDFQDGDRNGRIVIPRGNITDAVETNFKRDEEAKLPISFKALQPTDGSSIGYILFDDDTAFTAGS